jgi:hypothetical protein
VGRIRPEVTIAALSKKESAKSEESGPAKLRRSDTSRRNSSLEDKKPTRSKDSDHVDSTGKGRKDTTLQEPARFNDNNHADDMGRKYSPRKKSEKRTLFASQAEEAPESLRYPESKESTSEDSVAQEGTEGSMVKGCIETVDENASESEAQLGYFGLGLHD